MSRNYSNCPWAHASTCEVLSCARHAPRFFGIDVVQPGGLIGASSGWANEVTSVLVFADKADATNS
jgi:hypothetical protein